MTVIFYNGSPDTQPPAAPANLATTSKTATTISLAWTASTDNIAVAGYDIYNGTTLIGSAVNTTVYTVTGLSASTTYNFTVKAKDTVANISAASNVLSETTSPPDTEAPTAPINLVSTAVAAATVSLTWTASTDNVAVAGYDIYKGTTLVGSTSNTTVYTVTGLTASTTYNFTVKAKDASANISAASNVLNVATVSPDTEAPTAPSNVTFYREDDTHGALTWSPSTDNSEVAGYDVYQGATLIGSTTAATSFAISGLVANTTYIFTVKAKDASANVSTESAPSVGAPNPDSYEPNGTAASSQTILYNTRYTSHISSSTDADFYKITPTVTGINHLTVKVPVGKEDDVVIYDADMNPIATGLKSGGTTEEITFNVTAGQTYTIKIYGVNGSFSVLPYSFMLSQIQYTYHYDASNRVTYVSYQKGMYNYRKDYIYDNNGNFLNKVTTQTEAN